MDETSIKGMIQSMAQSAAGIDLVQGTVTQASPLRIQVAGDDKLVITETNTIVPWHLTDYATTADIYDDLYDGTLEGSSTIGSAAMSEANRLLLTNATVKIHNALEVGDVVHLLQFKGGKQYYVLDRVRG